MSSLTLKPSFPTSKLSFSSSSSFIFPHFSSISLPRKPINGFALRLRAYDSSKSDKPDASSGDSKPPNGTLVFPSPSPFLSLLSFCVFSSSLRFIYSRDVLSKCQPKLVGSLKLSSSVDLGCTVFSIIFSGIVNRVC